MIVTNRPNVIESLDFESILSANKSVLLGIYPDAADVIDNESEPLCKVLQAFAYRELVLRQRVNESLLAVMLAFAEKQDLDDVAWDQYRLKRLVITPATETTEAVMESDAALRQRCLQSASEVSVAGPAPYFEALAKNAHGDVADARAMSIIAGVVNVYVLSHNNNGTAQPDVLAAVDAVITSPDRRPITAQVNTLQSPVTEVVVDATLVMPGSPSSATVEALAAANSAMAAFASERAIGQQLALSKLHSVLHVPGVAQVVLSNPAADVIPDAYGSVVITGFNIGVSND